MIGDTIPDGTESAIAFKGGSGQSIIHGHYRAWGMGINSCSDEISVWEDNPGHDWLLELAESNVPDDEFVSVIQQKYGVDDE